MPECGRADGAQIAIRRSRPANHGAPDLKQALRPVLPTERAVREVSRMLAAAGQIRRRSPRGCPGSLAVHPTPARPEQSTSSLAARRLGGCAATSANGPNRVTEFDGIAVDQVPIGERSNDCSRMPTDSREVHPAEQGAPPIQGSSLKDFVCFGLMLWKCRRSVVAIVSIFRRSAIATIDASTKPICGIAAHHLTNAPDRTGAGPRRRARRRQGSGRRPAPPVRQAGSEQVGDLRQRGNADDEQLGDVVEPGAGRLVPAIVGIGQRVEDPGVDQDGHQAGRRRRAARRAGFGRDFAAGRRVASNSSSSWRSAISARPLRPAAMNPSRPVRCPRCRHALRHGLPDERGHRPAIPTRQRLELALELRIDEQRRPFHMTYASIYAGPSVGRRLPRRRFVVSSCVSATVLADCYRVEEFE